jgi:hypothetical protein
MYNLASSKLLEELDFCDSRSSCFKERFRQVSSVTVYNNFFYWPLETEWSTIFLSSLSISNRL